MQQQTRQRTRKKRKNTPLPEKRRRKRQTTHSRHANTTLQHMVNHTPPFQQKERRMVKKSEGLDNTKQSNTTRKTQWCSGITCVLAKLRAHYPEHHNKEEEKERETRKTRQATRTTHPSPHRHSTTHNTIRQNKTRQDLHYRHNKVICRHH